MNFQVTAQSKLIVDEQLAKSAVEDLRAQRRCLNVLDISIATSALADNLTKSIAYGAATPADSLSVSLDQQSVQSMSLSSGFFLDSIAANTGDTLVDSRINCEFNKKHKKISLATLYGGGYGGSFGDANNEKEARIADVCKINPAFLPLAKAVLSGAVRHASADEHEHIYSQPCAPDNTAVSCLALLASALDAGQDEWSVYKIIEESVVSKDELYGTFFRPLLQYTIARKDIPVFSKAPSVMYHSRHFRYDAILLSSSELAEEVAKVSNYVSNQRG